MTDFSKSNTEVWASTMPGPLMAGKRGLIMGVANHNSIAWGIAQALHQHGAELAFTCQSQALERRVQPLAEQVGSDIVELCDVEDMEVLGGVFDRLASRWDRLDFVVHAIAYSDKEELKGRYVDTSQENFRRTMDVSCYSFTAVAHHAAKMMTNGGSLLSLVFMAPKRSCPTITSWAWQKRPWRRLLNIWRTILAIRVSGSTGSRPGPCAPWPEVLSVARGIFCGVPRKLHR